MIFLNEETQSQLGSFGTRLHHLRLARGWTLQDLAEQSGLSRAFLSRLEAGDRQASIAAVLTLSRIFEVSLASLFEPEVDAEPCVIVRHAESEERIANGLAYVPLSKADSRFNLQPIRVRVSRSRRGIEHYHHEGEEWIYVLSGSLTLSLAGKTFDLKTGDAAHFDSRLPHRLIARGNKDPELLVVASPLSQTTPLRPGIGRERRAIPGMNLLDRSGPEIRSPHAVARKHPSAKPPKGKSPT